MTRSDRGSDDRQRDAGRVRSGRPERSGLLLAGGRSTRFGEPDKALAELAGTPLVRHAAAALVPVVDELVVNCRGDQRDALEAALVGLDDRLPVRFAVDPVPDQGPVAGLLAGLRVTRGRYVAVAGCDQPFLRTATIAELFDRATGEAEPSADSAAPLADGHLQPLGAVYRRDAAREAAVRTMTAGSQALCEVLTRVDPAAVPVESETVRDIDTQDELSEISDSEKPETRYRSRIMIPIGEHSLPVTNGSTSHAPPLPDGGER
ncbi:MAG: molybdenum cofactor guanylyltransferase [Haloglomus sp.]